MNKLLEAVSSGDLAEVSRFISEENDQTKFDNSALIEAFRGGRDDIAELLINAKIYSQPTRTHSHSSKLANPPEFSGLLGHRNDFSLASDFELLEPPLEGSKRWCNDEIMLNMDDKSVSSFSRLSRLPSPLLLATYYGRDKIVQKLIDEKMNLEEADYDGNTALILAIYSCHSGIVTMLLEAGTKVNHVNHYKGTALIAAAYVGDAIIAAKLIEHGALLNHEHQHDKVGTALMLAAQRGNTEVVEVLLTAEALVNQVSANGNTALHSAAQGGSLSSLHQLLRAGADVGAVNASGAFPLSLAAGGGHLSLVDALLDAGAESNHINSAVVAAARYGRLNVMQRLLDAGADQAKYLNRALIEAAKIGNVALINLLFNTKKINVNHIDNRTSALVVAAEGGHSEVVQKLIDEGADIQDIDVAMMAAAKRNSPDVVRILLEAGANLKSINSALVHAAQRGYLDCVNLLIDARANLSSLNRALIGAAQNNHPQVVSALLEAGANINSADANGDTALIKAMQARLYSFFNTEKRDMAIMALLSYEPDLSCANKKGDTAIKLAKNILESKRNALPTDLAEKLTEISEGKIEQVNTKQKVSGSLATLFFKANTDTEASKVEPNNEGLTP